MATDVRDEPLARSSATGTRTIASLWRSAAAEPRTTPAYLVERDGTWAEVSWEEAARAVDELANGLLSLGVRKGDAVGILASTSLEWVMTDFAIALIGAIGAPVYSNSSAADCAFILEHSEAVIVVVEDDEQAAKVAEFRERLPALRHVFRFDELDGVRERGRKYARESPGALDAAVDAVGEEDLFTYIYTSGTTGRPKGCMIRHRNYYVMADTVATAADLLEPSDVVMLFLPLAHNFGRLLHLTGAHAGYTSALLSDPLRVAEALPSVRPTVFPSVPRVYEKVTAAVKGTFAEATGPKRRLIDWALGVGYRASRYRRNGKPLPPGLALQHRVANQLVYSKVKERLGGRLRAGVSGGAPLAKDIAEFLHALDILVLEGYGLTECTTACSVNLPDRFRFGTVGRALPGFELATADDGEILIRSETVFAGYLKDPEATREVLTEDGWLRSGDVGKIDADGFLRVTDRKKDIIVTAGGKNVSPQNLENALKASPLVSQALVIGDRRPYVTALLTLDEQGAPAWGAEHGVPGDVCELALDPRLRAALQTVVDDVNAPLSRFEQVKRFAVLTRDFTPDEGEITPTMKVKRRVCEEHFAAEIDSLYE